MYMGISRFLSSLSHDQRVTLERKLLDRQGGKCFICDEAIDLVLQKGHLDIDHIDPLLQDGLDSENNFALTHASCNRSKGAANLLIARRLAQFERLQKSAQGAGQRGATLADILAQYNGASASLRIREIDQTAEFSLTQTGDNSIKKVPILIDKLSGMKSFFAALPIEYLHHDDRINPRSIGTNIRGLIEEFLQKRPQLHVGLAWWAPGSDGSGSVKVFDGQHKAAAQILLGVRTLPVRIFLEPDVNVLLQANTNAGGKLRQVAFDTAVIRHLGSSLYLDRVKQYQKMHSLTEDDYSFSEQDLVKFFRGERREMEKYIIDAQRDSITKGSALLEFIEWAGKSADRPISYITIERSFFREFLFKKALDTSIDLGIEDGSNPRQLEREQLIRIMGLFAETFFVGQWDPEKGGRRIESRMQKGEVVPEGHLRAWRIAREEILTNIMRWTRLVIANYNAFTGRTTREDKLLHERLPDELWRRLHTFLENMSKLPCWIDRNLSNTVFGTKQSLDYWESIFNTGKAPGNLQVLAAPLNLQEMIKER
jgi:HNH endonuclease